MGMKIFAKSAKRTPTGFKVFDKNAKRDVKKIKMIERYEDPNNPGSYLHTKHIVWEAAAPPDISVPGVGIEMDPPDALFGAVDYIVSWTVETNSSADAYSWNVRVNWYVNGSYVAYDLVWQLYGSVTLTGYNVSDDVYAVVYYVNNDGAADGSLWVTTSTI